MMTFFYFSNPLLRYFQEHFNCDIKSIIVPFLSKCTTFFVLSSRSLRFLGHVENQKYHKIKPNKYRVSQILKISYESYPDYWQDQGCHSQLQCELLQNSRHAWCIILTRILSRTESIFRDPHFLLTLGLLCASFSEKFLKYKNVMS